MARTPDQLTADDLAFLAERHLGTLTTLRADGSPHVVAIAFTYEDGFVSMISSDGTQKVLNVEERGRAVVCQVDGRRWLALEGDGVVLRDADRVGEGERSFERRYRPVRENPRRVVIRIEVDRILGRA
ncbi:MAG TPA: TIGR03618 family F420-dependent PPOX class oxidoreductase [Acidimicrobiia bacterium]|nr:TIGR03618 family F420-dependent PPOX class oxidoreductase [Acidimicrobiia bacterium]